MTKKDQKDINLEEELKKAEKHNSERTSNSSQIDAEINSAGQKMEKQIQDLTSKLTQQEEITKQAQYNYINLKMDFERLQRQADEKEKNMETESLISTMKKLLPSIENLRKSLENISEDQKDNPLAKGLELIYNNFLKTLEDMNVYPIQAIGLVPDSLLHEPVSVQPTDKNKMKGKIMSEFDRGFYYQKDGEKLVILASKVIVGQ